MTEPSAAQDRPAGQIVQLTPSVHRRVAVHGSGGVSATIVVVARQGLVWLSVLPPFTWEIILKPGQVDELARTLKLAQQDATRMAPATRKRMPHPDQAIIRKVTGGGS